MLEHRFVRLAGVRRCTLAVAMALIAPSVVLGSAPPALAVEHHPKGNYAPFADCPLSDSAARLCLFGEMTSGGFTIGKKSVALDHAILVHGGTSENEETGELTFIAAEDGDTLSKAALGVPGGLLGIVAPGYLPRSLRELLEQLVGKGSAGVTLTAELARPASAIKLSFENLLFEEGVALQLPVKIRLSNPFLGNNCYLGSSSAPIYLNMTTGSTTPSPPNRPMTGSSGQLSILEGGSMVILTGTLLVDDTFAAPTATGCGGSSSAVVDAAIDAELGLPLATGHNTAILGGKLELAVGQAVQESE
jgi:hypothetical protein